VRLSQCLRLNSRSLCLELNLSLQQVEGYLVQHLLNQLPLVLVAGAFLAHLLNPLLLECACSELHLLKESHSELVPLLCLLDYLVLQRHPLGLVQVTPTTQDLVSHLLIKAIIEGLCPTHKSNSRHLCSMHNTRM